MNTIAFDKWNEETTAKQNKYGYKGMPQKIGDMPDDLSKLIQDFVRPKDTYFRITIDTDIGGCYDETKKEKRFYDKDKADKYWEQLVDEFEGAYYHHINYQKWVYALPKDVYSFVDEESEKRWCIVPRCEKVVQRYTCDICNGECYYAKNDPFVLDMPSETDRHYECEICGNNICGECVTERNNYNFCEWCESDSELEDEEE